jgi:outer membrane protein
MERVKLLFFAGMLVLFFSTPGYCQGALISLDYNISVPTGDMKNYISETGYQGISVESRAFIKHNFSVGFFFGWHIFGQQTDQPLIFKDGSSIAGNQDRKLRSYPFLLSVHYYLGKENNFRPYIGANGGAFFIQQKLEANNQIYEEGNWHLGLAPEAGFLLPVSWYANIHFNVKYNYAFEAGKSVTGAKTTYSYWGINIGLAYFFSSIF